MMKKLVKRLILLGIVLIVLIVGGVFHYIDRVAKAGVETGATYALGVNTTLDGMNVGVLKGRVDMSKLSVANPSGYKSSHFLKLGDGRLAVSLGTLMQDKVVVPELTFSDVRLYLERKGGKANYQAILDNLKKFETKQKTDPAKEKQGKKFLIETIAIRDVQVEVAVLPIGGSLTNIPVTIDQIKLENVGSDSDKGVVLADVADIIIKAILKSVADGTSGVLPADFTADLNQSLSQLNGFGNVGVQVVGDVKAQVDKLTSQLQGTSEQVSDTVAETREKVDKGIEDAGKKLGEGLGGLLGSGKKEEDEKK
jgi:uncharacterized protein involved in outer membrane biogenesis